MHDDEDLFAAAMSRVEPLKPADKHIPPRKAKRPVAATPAKTATRYVRPAPVQAPKASSEQAWTLVANGVSRERLRRLASGTPPIEASFDLHGMTRAEALACLEQGFAAMLEERRRVACIIHGRGLHSDGRPVLKHATYHWLAEGPFAGHVLAVIPQPGSGGGACLVLLRRI